MDDVKTIAAHHEFGPSRYNAWAKCPAFRQADHSDWDGDASAGSAAHEELSKCLSRIGYTSENKAAQWAADEIRMLAYAFDRPEHTWFIGSEVRVEGRTGILNGVFGTIDATWYDNDKRERHIADFKTFSDGNEDYTPQLYGYGALYAQAELMRRDETIVLHVIHGMARRVETVVTDAGTCIDRTEALLKSVIEGGEPSICKWCKWCFRAGKCSASCTAVDTVSTGGGVFASLSLCQKLVVCDAVMAIADNLKREARAMAEASPDKAIEMDGIRYELKPWAGKPKCMDVRDLASAVDCYNDDGTFNIREFDAKSAEIKCTSLRGIPPEEFVGLCEVTKKRVVDAVMKKNEGNPAVKRAMVDRFVSRYFDKVEGAPHFVRVK